MGAADPNAASSRPTTSAARCPISSTRSSAGPSARPWPASPGPDRLLVVRDMRASGVELSGGVRRGCPLRVGAAVTDLGMASTDFLYFAVGRLDAPGRHVHRLAQPGRLQRDQDVPGRGPPDRPGHRAGRDPAPGRGAPGAPRRRRRIAGRARPRATCWTTTPSTSARSSTARRLRPLQGGGRHGQRDGRPRRPRSSSGRCPSRSTILFGELDGTFPNHPADPIQPENLVDLKAAVLEHGADVGPGLRRRRRPGLPGGRAGRAGVGIADDRPRGARPCSTSTRAPPSSTTSSARKVVPEVIAENGGVGGPHPGRPLLHQRDDGRDRGGVRRRALRALLLRRQLPGRLGDHRRAWWSSS